MKIQWKKCSKALEGYVGDVLCFHMIPEAGQVQLVCELPEAVPNCYGRYVTNHHSGKAADVEAHKLLKGWLKRFGRC